MRVLLVQFAIDNHDPEQNRERAAGLLRAHHVLDPIPPRSLVVLPELFSTGTLPADFDTASASALAQTDRNFLASLARETGSYVLAGILKASADSGKPFNIAALFDPDGVEILDYAKIHPFSLGGEHLIFEGGDAVPTAPVEGFTVQAAVCYDLRFPELFRAGSQRGVDLIAIPANWPESRREHWDVLLRARAIENQSFVVGVNCIGTQRGTKYVGGSCIVSPKGEVVATAGDAECVISGEIAADQVRNWRRVFPALRDRKSGGFWDAEPPA